MSYYITTSAAMLYYMLATESGDREVGGYAKFDIDKDGDYIISDLRAIKQQSSEVFFEISPEDNALFLEDLVASGEDTGKWSMLFHTHPSGMSASMSTTDINQISEMAKDLPGTIVRSMILPQGRLIPTMHEATCVDGQVFIRSDIQITLLDETGAIDMLEKIDWFKKPEPQTPSFTSLWSNAHTVWPNTAGALASSRSSQQHENVLPAPTEEENNQYLKACNDIYNTYVDQQVYYNGKTDTIIDAYEWDGSVIVMMSDGTEVELEAVTFVGDVQQA